VHGRQRSALKLSNKKSVLKAAVESAAAPSKEKKAGRYHITPLHSAPIRRGPRAKACECVEEVVRRRECWGFGWLLLACLLAYGSNADLLEPL
jgi:hypothetical protein